MASKKGQGKAKKGAGLEEEERREEMAALRKNKIVFAPVLKQEDLVQRYSLMWGRETAAHPAPQVFLGSAKYSGDKYPFFTTYFFSKIMYTYGFHLLDFTPNAMTLMSVFAHMCENFVGLAPNVALFRHYFVPTHRSRRPFQRHYLAP